MIGLKWTGIENTLHGYNMQAGCEEGGFTEFYLYFFYISINFCQVYLQIDFFYILILTQIFILVPN